jgi:hypothetical protein
MTFELLKVCRQANLAWIELHQRKRNEINEMKREQRKQNEID